MKRTLIPALCALTVAAAALAGCGGDSTGTDGGQQDLATSGGDLAKPMDLSVGDQASNDQAVPADLKLTADLTPVDLTQPPDLVPTTPSGQIGNVRLAATTANPDA